jgi:hypothetical protein
VASFITIANFLSDAWRMPLDKITEEVPSLQWLRGDLHSHCEDHSLIEAHIEGAADRPEQPRTETNLF